MLSKVSEFLGKIESDYAISSLVNFSGASSKFSYIRIGLLGDSPGDDALDYLLASESLCELIVITGGVCFDENGEFALIADPNRPETARIISNSDNSDIKPLGLENVVEYLKDILEYSETKAFAVAAILKANGSQNPDHASHYIDPEILFSHDYSLNIEEIKEKAEPIETKFEYMCFDESDSAGYFSGYLAYAVSTSNNWGFEPEIAILKDGRIGVCQEANSEEIDWENIESLKAKEDVTIFESLSDIYGSYPDERLEITIILDQTIAGNW